MIELITSDDEDAAMYKAGLTASGCWDELDEYDRNAIIRYGRFLVEIIKQKECQTTE